MAKRRSTVAGGVDAAGIRSTTEQKALGFAEDLGRILGTAQAKAEGWLNQRKEIAHQLAQIRDTANKYLQQLTGGGANMAVAVAQARRGRPPGSKNKRAASAAGQGKRKGRRKMSAAARKAISEAQKKRWAKQKSKDA